MTISVLICCEGKGRWCLKARPGETQSPRDTLDMLEQMGAVDATTAATTRRILDVLDGEAR